MSMVHIRQSCAALVWGVGLLVVPCALGDLLPPMNGYASDFAERRAGASVDASIRIVTASAGLHRLTYEQLVAAGVASQKLVGSDLRLFNRDREVSIYVSTSSSFSSGDFCLFYAEAYESTQTRENVYWLGFGTGGLRMATRSGSPGTGDPEVTEYTHEAVYAPELIYVAPYRPSDASIDHWFAAFMSKSYCENHAFSLDTPDRLTGRTATLEATLHGMSSDEVYNPDHKTRIYVGGGLLGNIWFEAQNEHTESMDFSTDLLADGASSIIVTQLHGGVAIDSAFLEHLTISYPRSLTALNDTLAFAGESGARNYQCDGFVSDDAFYVADVTNPVAPVLLTGWEVSGGSGNYVLRFGDDADAAEYCAAEAAGLVAPALVERVSFRHLAVTNRQADYIIVCPSAFRNSAYRLLKHRHLQGLRVAVAPLEDVYNEFSYGIEDPAAIKQCLGFAFHHWQASPQYVLLLGDATYDPKENLGATANNVLPSYLGPSSWRWTCLDNWFALVNGQDELLDFAIGRIPATSDGKVDAIVNKIVAFEAAVAGSPAWAGKATLVADDNDGVNDFRVASEAGVRPYLQGAGMTLTKVYLDDVPYSGDPTIARSAIAGSFGSGRLLLTFFGHGAEDIWTDEETWRNADVIQLSNSIYPIVAMFTCQNGYFVDRSIKCIAERHIDWTAGGASACFAPSILARPSYSQYVAEGFTEAIVASGGVRIGDAAVNGCLNLFENGNPYVEELRAYQIFGDPAMVVSYP